MSNNMVYGHVQYYPPDEEIANMVDAKQQFKDKCTALHNAVVDMVNKPPHYTSGTIECIDYIKDVLTKEEYIGYLRGCMIKYQHRLRHKGDSVENAGKMEWYNKKLKEALNETN
jgi:hypothetical protein